MEDMKQWDAAELARRAVRGSGEAFARLAEGVKMSLYKAAWAKMSNEADALDAVDETMKNQNRTGCEKGRQANDVNRGGEKVCKARQCAHWEGSVYETYVTAHSGRDNEAWRALSPPHHING